MKKLLIINTCVGKNGAILEKDSIIEAETDLTYILIAAGKALDASTDEAKAIIAENKRQADLAAKAEKSGK